MKLISEGTISISGRNNIEQNTRIIASNNSEVRIEGSNHTIGNGTILQAFNGGKIILGDRVSFNTNCYIVSHKAIKICEKTIFGPNVICVDHDHDYRSVEGVSSQQYKCSEITIGSNCWIGGNVTILRGTSIGNNCVIGAGSVIKGHIPDNSIVIQKRETEIKDI